MENAIGKIQTAGICESKEPGFPTDNGEEPKEVGGTCRMKET